MPTTQLYGVPLPEATRPQEREGLGTQLSEQGVLDRDSIVEALSTQAADLTLTGRYAYGTYFSELLATELEELSNSTLSGLPLFGGAKSRSGYYEIESATVEPVHSAGRDIWEWELSLTSVGTEKDQYEAITLSPSDDLTNPFGTDDSVTVAIPSAARLVRAIDARSEPSTRVKPTPTETVATAHGAIDVYDTSEVAIDEPIYIYDVAKSAQPPVDVHVYDTNGRDTEYIEADTGRVRAWQSVYDAAHEFDGGAVVLSNGRLRLRIDEPDAGDESATLAAERWDTGTDSWAAVSLPSYDAELATDWQPVDVDLTRIGQAAVHALVEFEAVAGDAAGDIITLDVRLFRGWSDALVTIPPRESGPIPPALYDLVEPIASGRVVDPGVEQTLIARSVVR
ncbi:hypothetical protein HALG_00047 [Halorubrum virus CGphi46]|uniref:Uncharacterized protein n=1 Tax=Halorubrum virus CGphi46 TaxID=754066 RepID=R9TNX8_9CAUD|nr:hypothetical protein HALG_00047 [Halorubrum virus CGphi46]AGN33835.1 hypothetical protein HALG_00047 [Halorubrum virus CGphi46]